MAKVDDSELENEEEEVIDDQLQEDDSQEDLQDDVKDEQEDEQEEDGLGDEEEDSDEEEPKEKPSRRETLRINDLLKKYGAPQERNDTSKNDDAITFRDDVDADDDTLEQLDKKSNDYAARRYNEGLARAEYLNWNTNLKIETPLVHQEHPQMGDKVIADSINNEYLNFVGYNQQTGTVARPDVSYKDFVDARFEQAEAIAEAMTEKTRRNITKQAGRTAIRPDGSSAKRLDLSKAPQAMSDEELDAYIAKQGFAPKK